MAEMIHPDVKENYGMNERIWKLNRMNRETPKSLDLTLARAFTKSYKETEMLPPVIRRAKTFAEVADTMPIYLEEGQLIIGNPTARYHAGQINPMMSAIWVTGSGGPKSLAERDFGAIQVDEGLQEEWMEVISPYWLPKNIIPRLMQKLPRDLTKRCIGSGFIEASYMCGLWGSHTHPDWERLVEGGLNAIRNYAKDWLSKYDPLDPEQNGKDNFYQAIVIEMDAVERYAKRCAEYAREKAKAETDAKRKAELTQIARNCDRVPMEPPTTFYEGLQFIWFIQMLQTWEGGAATLGRVDQYMWPLYKKDLDQKLMTREEAKEYLECFYHKLAAAITIQDPTSNRFLQGEMTYWHIQTGGYDIHGNDATNDLSLLLLEAVTDTHTSQPHMGVRLNPKSPQDYRMAIIDLIAEGTGQPSIYNDVVSGQIILKRGESQEDAYNYDSAGCMEVGRAGNYWWAPGVWMNGGMFVEMAFTQGKKRDNVFGTCLGEQLSVETPDPRTFKTYEEFEDAVKEHCAYAMKSVLAIDKNVVEMYRDFPVVFQSVIQHQGLWRGLPFHEGGCWSSCCPGFDLMGIPDVGNSLAVVKKLVFDDKTITMDQLCNALDANFEGYEEIRQMCLNVPKYGNDDDYVDSITMEFMDWIATYCKQFEGLMAKYDPDQEDAKKRHTVGMAWAPLSGSVEFGKQVGALPSGRLSGEPLGDSCAPYMGTDLKGPTAALRSVAKLPHNKTDGTITNMYITKDLLSTMEGRMAVSDLIQTFFDEGGAQVQFSCTNQDILRDAQEHPEKYPNLMVRVAGYSAYFVDLSKDVQDSILMRTAHNEL